MSKKDALKRLFELQRKFDLTVQTKEPFSKWTPAERINMLMDALIGEAFEVKEELGFFPIGGGRKWWKKKVNRSKVKVELVDCQHFLLSAMLQVGMTPEELLNVYIEKNKENHNRQERGY